MIYVLGLICVGQALVLAYAIRRFSDMLSAERLERRNLLDRIQAPERAAAIAMTDDLPPSPPAVGFDDDEDFHLAKMEAMDGRTGPT